MKLNKKIEKIFTRKKDSQKGDYGKILIIAGSGGMGGAACLAAEATLRAGAGLVYLGVPESLMPLIEKKCAKEVITVSFPQTKARSFSLKSFRTILEFSKTVDIVALGPGLSKDLQTQQLVRKILKTLNRPLVVDADGINAFAGHLDCLKRHRNGLILTPHPGELSRLIKLPIKKVQQQRKTIAKTVAFDYNLVLVLKGYRTVIAKSDGSVFVNPSGNPGMATAGSGDVLTGMIAAFLGQGLDLFAAAKLGVYLHGLAGDLAARKKGEISLVASDIIEKIPAAIKKYPRKNKLLPSGPTGRRPGG